MQLHEAGVQDLQQDTQAHVLLEDKDMQVLHIQDPGDTHNKEDAQDLQQDTQEHALLDEAIKHTQVVRKGGEA